MLQSLRAHWREYLIEAWALGMFMVSASIFVILLEHPAAGVKQALDSPLLRRFLVGLAMGVTAVLLIYSPWGKRSGAHMNPAVTLTFLTLDRIGRCDAAWYILAQFAGGSLGVALFKWFFHDLISSPDVNYVVTVPGPAGAFAALAFEALLAFTLLTTVLWSSNHARMAPYTGYLAGAWLVVFITFEAPWSGMSINPARTVASALSSNVWTAWWIYFLGPVAGMLSAGVLYRRLYRAKHAGNCLGMKCHLSGDRHDCLTYQVLGPEGVLEKFGKAG